MISLHFIISSSHFKKLNFPFFRKDSDVLCDYWPTTGLEPARDKNRLAQLPAIIANKTKTVAWIVSNCDSKSGREAYVTELEKYINVDIYGKCGPLNCSDCSKFIH